MAPKRQPREYSAAELAMIDDIGAGRVDKLPMEDSGMLPRGASAIESLESRRTGLQNSWNEAIKNGKFEDEDAAFVVGQQELANGSLARMRRAAEASYMALNTHFNFNDRRLRQNRNGQVAPRAQFSRGERGPSRAGLTHTGDGPVELRGSAHHSGQPASARPMTTPAHHARPVAQPTAVLVQTHGPQQDVQVRTTDTGMKFQLSAGHSILFQAAVRFASPMFNDRTGEYPGTIYLVDGPVGADDQIILHLDEDSVEDVKRRTKEYVDYLSDSDRLILQFKDDAGCTTWFVVIFRQRDIMESFVSALRDFTDRLKQPLATPVVTPAQADTMRGFSAAIVEDIVTWAIHIVSFIRDAGPPELATSDALPGIIRGASAAVLMEKHADFASLDSKQRVTFVDEVYAPQVFDRFKRRMFPNEPKSADAPSERCRLTYTTERLLQLHCKAYGKPPKLAEHEFLPQTTPETQVRIQQVIQRAHGVLKAPDLSIPTPGITVTTTDPMPTPEEPLIAIHGEMNGLNSSRHNKDGGDVLGTVAGQFTGVLANDKSHLADLMCLDGGEDFDLIRAQDPEVAEIADRFARVSFVD
ncbi:hypothetical protein KVR01_001465 [Diaporthe batatas]|uniref:uncharacterized protein n=1 Tax=Diaporthe batatas TaxID=748121 RepID=UPI001D053767|nr:uncharacterized protein KVR01_001465 [Diaporthe batatas]KAG8168716.1 hypothetical protein KVR01_001465 [Diaporthe batatas]